MAGLYIHIPFCGSRCAYCDFYSTTSPDRVVAFLEAVKREMTGRNVSSTERRPSPQAGEVSCEGDNTDGGSFVIPKLDTIYVGGGTPSLLAPERLQSLLDHAATLWESPVLREVTLEANPEDLTDDYLERLSATKFDRLSIGVQSFDDGLLRFMNRRHDAARARQAVRAAQRAGFTNISIDLIYGIPGMTDAQWERTLDEATALGVQHVSAYHLTIEPGTPFGRGSLGPIPEEVSERQFAVLREKLGAAGFEHYEVSNFALPGRRAVHNSAYWSGAPYLGVGPSAHSFDGVRRREWVVADLAKYLSGPVYGGETLSDRELANERVMTGLRTAEGVDAETLRGSEETVERFLRAGLLVRRGNRIAVPSEKFLLSDLVISELFV